MFTTRFSRRPACSPSNVFQHVALTYNTNTGIANLYLNGTNVATTNFGAAFVPKTDGDVLLGKDMCRTRTIIMAARWMK